jgi:hypothetical protein
MLSQNGKVAEYRNHIIKYPRSVAVNHAGLWIRRHQFESGRGYLILSIVSLLYHDAEEQ